MHTSSVLIIDDEEGIRETFRMALELEGYDVHAAANGKEALEALEQMRRPCLILVDLMMPIMNGWEFTAAVGNDAQLSTIPIVVVTAFADKAQGVLAHDVLRKPISLDALLAVVHQYCG
jgi:CheY-like chemotaxis protein